MQHWRRCFIVVICIIWQSNRLNHILNFLWWRWCESGDDKCDAEIQQHPNAADAFWRDSKEMIFGFPTEELEVNDVTKCEAYSSDHSGDGTFLINSLGENAHQ